MFRSLWRWLSSMVSLHSNPAKTTRFDAVIDEAQSEIAALIERYRRA